MPTAFNAGDMAGYNALNDYLETVVKGERLRTTILHAALALHEENQITLGDYKKSDHAELQLLQETIQEEMERRDGLPERGREIHATIIREAGRELLEHAQPSGKQADQRADFRTRATASKAKGGAGRGKGVDIDARLSREDLMRDIGFPKLRDEDID
jgi:hypothetical protein